MFCYMWTDWMPIEWITWINRLLKEITESFGKEIWHKGVVVLTHAQLTPPDCLSYDDFFGKRSEALLKVVESGARFKQREIQIGGVRSDFDFMKIAPPLHDNCKTISINSGICYQIKIEFNIMLSDAKC